MRRNFMLFTISVLMVATGCQKTMHDNQLEQDKLGESEAKNIIVDCTPETLSGTITTNTTLLTGKTYVLDGVVVVQGATLTIQPRTLILAKTSVASGLVIDKTAQINAIGTATDPIVFTSDKAPGTRAPGDWLGVFILGNAPNNQSNVLNYNIEGTNFSAGGTSPTSSAGRFEYVQLHFAGKGSSTGDVLTEGSLVLGSIGSGMTVKNIQVTNSLNDGLSVHGGLLGVKEVFTHKSQRWEFSISQGYRGNMQSLFGFKDDVATIATNVAMMDITNNLVGSNSAPFTYPTISNATLLGGTYCDGSDADYNRGIVIRENGSARIFNSVLEGFGDVGLFLDGSNVIAKTKTGTDQLVFSYNSLHNSGTPSYSQAFTAPHTTWAAADGCRLNPSGVMQNWIEGSVGVACQQDGNEFSIAATGYYRNSLCGNKCSTFPNLYIDESNTGLDAPNYSMLSGFDQPDYRGALQSSTDTWLKNTWVDFCAVTRNYCL